MYVPGCQPLRPTRTAAGWQSLVWRPKYERLKDHFVRQLAVGRLKSGDALPPEVRLAEVLQVARSTVRQATAQLESDGLVRRIPGKGTFVEEDARHKLRKGQDLFAMVVPDTQAGYTSSLLRTFDMTAGRMCHQVVVCNTDNDVHKQADILVQWISKCK